MRCLLDRLSASLAPAPDDDSVVAAAPAVTVREVIRRFWPLARPYRKPFVAGIALAALLPAVEAAEIWLFKLIVDDVLVAETLGPLAVCVPAMVGLALLGALLSFGDEYAATWVGERFTLALRTRLFAHLQRLEPDALDRRRHGDVLARLTGDVHAIETLLLSAVAELVQAAARLLFFAGALFLLSWKLALASLVVVPLFYFAARRFARLARRAARERRRRSGSLTAVAEEALANAALVQSANAQDHELARFRRENEGAIAAELAGTRISGLFAPVIDLIELAGAMIIIVLGTWALTAGDLTLGGLLAFLAYLAQLYRPVRDLSRLGQTVFEATAGAERVIELLDTRARGDRAPRRARRSAASAASSSSTRVAYTLPRRAAPGARRREPARAARPLRRGGRRQRRRQVDARQARAALRRPRPGRGAARRPRPARPHAALAARATSRCCCRRRRCSTAPCARTSPTAARTRPTTRSRAALEAAAAAGSRTSCPTASTRAPASAAARSRAASAGASRWRARCCRTRRCSCSTSRPPASTPSATRRLLGAAAAADARPRDAADHPRPRAGRRGRRGRRARGGGSSSAARRPRSRAAAWARCAAPA